MNGGEQHEHILRRVRASVAARRYDEAMLDLALLPESTEVRNLMGVVMLKRRRYRQAEEYLRRAVELDAANAEALNNLGLAVSYQRGRRREAVELFARAAELNPRSVASENLHKAARHWVGYAGLFASWVIFRMIRTAWMSGDWSGMWSPWAVAGWSALIVAVALLVARDRRRKLPVRARELLDDVARRTRAARRRNAVFDGALFVGFFGGMYWAIQRYDALQQSMGLRALMFLACLAVGLTLGALFRRLTGSLE
ncbi:MAG TPA: hypothetical protein VHJ78_06270 [Actinomycetota bacterium]|nr:hypothetical protein [Actinomycetota bacterium]